VTGGPAARQVWPQARTRTRALKDRLPDALAAAAGIWAAAALVLAVLIALAVTVAFILAVGLAVASAAPRAAATAREFPGTRSGAVPRLPGTRAPTTTPRRGPARAG
jgi:hypothetical protein